MAIEDDDKPRKKVTHEIGQDLSLLSVEELTERIALMTSEIERRQVAMTKKRASIRASHAGEMLRRAERVWRHRQKPIGRGLLLQRGQNRATKGTAGRLTGRLVERDLPPSRQLHPHSANGRHGKQSLKKIAAL